MLQIGSKEIYDDFIKLGLTPNKESRLSLPDVSDKYLRHFIRGCFDGDGCISYNYYRKSTNRNVRFMHQQVIFASASKGFIKELANRLSKVARTSYFCLKSAKDKNVHYLTFYRKEEIKKLFEFMYNKVDSSLYLNRKYNKFIEWIHLIGGVV